MPYCHFELEESDYLTSGRRAGETRPLQPGAPTPAPRDISTKVIEFHSCGLGVKHVRSDSRGKPFIPPLFPTVLCSSSALDLLPSSSSRRFNIVNPTNTSYQFGWLCEDSVSEEQPRSPFKCLSLGGSVEAGKKKEVSQTPPMCVVHVMCTVQYGCTLWLGVQYGCTLRLGVQYGCTLRLGVQYGCTLRLGVQYGCTLRLGVQYGCTLRLGVQYGCTLRLGV